MPVWIDKFIEQLEKKWDDMDEQSERARAFEDIDSYRLHRAQQGTVSMCAIMALKLAKQEGQSIEGYQRFIDKISTKTNIRGNSG